jgi:hypothetical protein
MANIKCLEPKKDANAQRRTTSIGGRASPVFIYFALVPSGGKGGRGVHLGSAIGALNLPTTCADMLIMNQRREPRLEANQRVWMTLFGEPEIRLQACIKNVSVRGIGLELEGPVAIGSPVKIELDDCLFLGEVIYCREDEASFFVGVQLEQALYGLTELARALGTFSDTPSGPQESDPVIKRRYQN